MFVDLSEFVLLFLVTCPSFVRLVSWRLFEWGGSSVRCDANFKLVVGSFSSSFCDVEASAL